MPPTDNLVFTTHTPVPAGIDCFHRDLMIPYLEPWGRGAVGGPGRRAPGPGTGPGRRQPFQHGRTRPSSGESRQRGLQAARRGEPWPFRRDGDRRRQRFASITNGVGRTWVLPQIQSVFDDALGRGWPTAIPPRGTG